MHSDHICYVYTPQTKFYLVKSPNPFFFPDSNPDKYYPNWYSVLIASWIFFGMAWLALVINHSIEILERLNSFFKKLFKKDDNQQEDEAGDAADKNPETQMEEEDEIIQPPVTPEST